MCSVKSKHHGDLIPTIIHLKKTWTSSSFPCKTLNRFFFALNLCFYSISTKGCCPSLYLSSLKAFIPHPVLFCFNKNVCIKGNEKFPETTRPQIAKTYSVLVITMISRTRSKKLTNIPHVLINIQQPNTILVGLHLLRRWESIFLFELMDGYEYYFLLGWNRALFLFWGCF